MSAENVHTRRSFIHLSASLLAGLAGILGLAGLFRFFSHQPGSGQPRVHDLGPARDFPASGRLIRLDIPAVIYKDSAAYRAYSLRCTHLGCTLEENGEIFTCPCHGSEFSPQGRLLKGPAESDLDALGVEINAEGNLILDTQGAER